MQPWPLAANVDTVQLHKEFATMITPLEIADVKIIKPRILRDERGFFSETYNQKGLGEQGFHEVFVQDNHSLSTERGVVRGLHFQSHKRAQGKLVRVTRGAIFDVAVDIRRGSPTYGQHVSRVLSAENWEQIWLPVGFAHGFCTLELNTEVIYKVTDVYAPDCDYGLAWNDPKLGISWPVGEGEAILSRKDRSQPRLADLPVYFEF
jgi:dTDP-4-dehydrorhamnose 3,5-epimerase